MKSDFVVDHKYSVTVKVYYNYKSNLDPSDVRYFDDRKEAAIFVDECLRSDRVSRVVMLSNTITTFKDSDSKED